MQGKRIIQSLRLRDFLSFGSQTQDIELQPLNVLIGPNASGKSNMIEAFRILNATPEDVGKPIREGGGISEYRWKGKSSTSGLEIGVNLSRQDGDCALAYSITIADENSWIKVVKESIEPIFTEDTFPLIPEFFYRSLDQGHGVMYLKNVKTHSDGESISYLPQEFPVSTTLSILSQRKDPTGLPALTYLQDVFPSIHFYTGWDSARYGALRYRQKADLPSTTLLEDGSNLGLVLINKPASVRQQITERLKAVLPSVEEIFPKLEGGTVPLYIREKGFSTPIPATRLSEGTLRYLCLLTLLLDPTPPPIICLEEPEAGLHPHVVSQIAELLIDASQRTQLIVTTHSDALISGLTDCPEAIIICERDEDGTKLRRLEAEQIKPWLDRYAIGDLWRMGEIGGVR